MKELGNSRSSTGRVVARRQALLCLNTNPWRPPWSSSAELAGARQRDREVNERTCHTWMNVSGPAHACTRLGPCVCPPSVQFWLLVICSLHSSLHRWPALSARHPLPTPILSSLPAHRPRAAGPPAGALPRRGGTVARALGCRAGSGGAASGAPAAGRRPALGLSSRVEVRRPPGLTSSASCIEVQPRLVVQRAGQARPAACIVFTAVALWKFVG